MAKGPRTGSVPSTSRFTGAGKSRQTPTGGKPQVNGIPMKGC